MLFQKDKFQCLLYEFFQFDFFDLAFGIHLILNHKGGASTEQTLTNYADGIPANGISFIRATLNLQSTFNMRLFAGTQA